MELKIFILMCMVFCHIVDDYYLQGWLASAKQKDWWAVNCPLSKYKYDYIMALFMHSFSWSFMVMLPCHVETMIFGIPGNSHFVIIDGILFVLNIIIHMFVDNLKANKHKINLIQDQLIHLLQIAFTWYCCIFREGVI